jgi:hypothetical protein
MKVLIGTPAYGGQVTEAYFQSVLQFKNVAFAGGLDVSIMTLTNESLITRARNDIVATFMAGDYTDLLFIDADIKFTPEHVLRVLESPHAVTATPYAMKAINWDAAAAVQGNADEMKNAAIYSVVNQIQDAKTVDGYTPVLDAGTGFMRIQRPVLELMIRAYPELAYVSDGKNDGGTARWALFDTSIENGRYLSEDYTFCRRWQALGGEVWADVASPNLGHQGSYTYGR